ncbi:phosphatase PAP2 family protein [Myxococcota bacterium]|nr:phosphatase PAP2 family protein [Myxococcota bacterium]
MLAPLVAVAALATAQAPGQLYELRPAFDVGTTVSMGLVGYLVDQAKHDFDALGPCPERPSGLCDAATVNGLDRWVTTQSSTLARRLSDLLVLSIATAPLALSGVELATSDGIADPGRRFGEESLVTLQVYGLTLLSTNLIKVAVKRPRPLTYNPAFSAEARFDGDARLSFPSGHSSMAFAAATTLALGLFDRHGGSAGAWTGAALGYGAATTVASLRMLGGKHFVTDVVAGAVLGTVVAVVVTRAHRPDGRAEVAATGGSGEALVGGFAWTGEW